MANRNGQDGAPLTGDQALAKLVDDLRFPMADVRQILENFTVGNWKTALIIGDPKKPQQSIMMVDDGFSGEELLAVIEGALNKAGDSTDEHG